MFLNKLLKLTENEKREVVSLIESEKVLPDKYRFLLFEEKREVELVWSGKSTHVCNIVLPFQTIEQVDEPRAEKPSTPPPNQLVQPDLFSVDDRGRQLKGWTNKLIWGDNKLILSSLKNGPLREEIEKQGGLKLIYIDPPFDIGADFSMKIEIGEEAFTKNPNVLEEIAYRDTWGKGVDSFIAMIYERLILMKDLLSQDGSIYVHCDWRVNALMRLALDEIFGRDNFRNEIVWGYRTGGISKNRWPRKHDILLCYGISETTIHNPLTERIYYEKPFFTTKQDENGNHYADVFIRDVWDDIKAVINVSKEQLHYPTQKPEALLERIISASTNEGDLVADFFCGSGTTAAVAERLARKWICADLGKFAIHTTRKRMICLQRELKKKGQVYRSFEILNMGKYERQHYIGVNTNLREEQQKQQLANREVFFLDLILRAYKAEKAQGFESFHGKRNGRLVTIGPINMPVTRLYVKKIMEECLEYRITRVEILGFEFEMGIFLNMLDEARNLGINIVPKYIPRDVFDKRVVEKNQVVFHDVAYIEVIPHINGKNVAIELTDFSVNFSQDAFDSVEESLRKRSSRVVVENGQIYKVQRDKDGVLSKEQLTKYWTDWVDYWSVDFDFESKREIIRVYDSETENFEEQWTGDYIFENEWQSFRTKENRSLELISAAYDCAPGRRKFAVKVVDIFGNDTIKTLEFDV